MSSFKAISNVHTYDIVGMSPASSSKKSFFISNIFCLLGLKQPFNIQRRSLDVLNARLHQREQGQRVIGKNVENILESLTTLVESRGKVNGPPTNQQVALLCIKTLAKNYSGNEQVVKEMKNVCSRLSAQAVLDSFKEEPVVGAGIICLSEILQCLQSL